MSTGVTLPVKKGETRKLPPGAAYLAGLGWDAAQGQQTVDLDLWVIRKYADGRAEALYWGQTAWYRPDLGSTHDGNPYIASPEGDLLYSGDDRTGAQSDTGYDETVNLDLSKTPADVVQYAIFVTNYSDDNSQTMGMATNVVCGVQEEATGNKLETQLVDNHGFDLSVLVCTIDRTDDGKWEMHAKQEGFTDPMPTIATTLGVVGFPQ